MYNLIHIETGLILQRSIEPFPVDEGGDFPDGIFASLEDAEDPKPEEVEDGFTLESFQEVDKASGKLWKRWRVVPVVIGPVPKLTIKERVTEAEWSRLKFLIAAYRGHADATLAAIASDWEDATVIDPAHPRTQAMIQALQAEGTLHTSPNAIFATNAPAA